MIDDAPPPTRASRFLLAALGLAFAVFFGALAYGILSATATGPKTIAWLIRGFVFFMFGGIGASALYWVAKTLRGEDALAHNAPEALRARCLTCGELTPASEVCRICEEPPHDRAKHVRVERSGFFSSAFGAAICAALLCLGVFILVGPYSEGERRIWALLAFGALGLFITIIGVAGLVSAVGVMREALGNRSKISYNVHGRERNACGAGACNRGKLLWVEGHGSVASPLVAKLRSEGGYRASPGDIAFAELVATLDAAGIVELTDMTTYDWKLGEKPPEGKRAEAGPLSYQRNTRRETFLTLTLASSVAADEDDRLVCTPETQERKKPLYFMVQCFFARWLRHTSPLSDFRRATMIDTSHRAQAEVHARALREAGVLVAQELVDAVLDRIDPR